MSVKSRPKTDYWKTHHQHNHSWNNVASGYWSRYPNPHSGHVLTVDMLETKIVEGKLYTKRFILKNNPLPRWGENFFTARRVGLIEECLVDPVNKTMVAYVRNIGLTKFMGTTEKATFLPHDGNTTVQKECWIDSSIYGFRSAIRRFGMERYKKNCILATKGFEFVLDKMLKKSEDIGQPGSSDSTQKGSQSYCELTKSCDNHSSLICDKEASKSSLICDKEASKPSLICDKGTSPTETKSTKQAKVTTMSGIPVGSYGFKTDTIVQ